MSSRIQELPIVPLQNESVDILFWACHLVVKQWPLQLQTLCPYNDQSRKVSKGVKVDLFIYLSLHHGENSCPGGSHGFFAQN